MGLSTRKVRVERGPSAEPGLAVYFIEQLALGGSLANDLHQSSLDVAKYCRHGGGRGAHATMDTNSNPARNRIPYTS